jgi:hypothetical protein
LEIFCVIDWAERHHDVAVLDQTGRGARSQGTQGTQQVELTTRRRSTGTLPALTSIALRELSCG